MLQSIRDRLTGPLVWFVIGLIAIPFAFWGVDSFRTGGSDPLVAKVGDEEITQGRFKQSYTQRYQQYRSLMGDAFRADLFDENLFRNLTLKDMVQELALREYALDRGFRVSDESMRQFLLQVPAFQEDGRFSPELYRQLLARQGRAPSEYESQLRESMAIDQLRSSVQESGFATELEAQRVLKLEKQKRKVLVVPVSADDFRDKVEVSEAQISEQYEKDKGIYMSPERLKVSYVELDRNALPEIEKPEPEVLKAIYESQKIASFTTVEERKARHILINSSEDDDAAEAKINSLKARIDSGEAFSEVAKDASEDSGSREQGGDLGWIKRGLMDPVFEDALFELSAGEVSAPIKTDFGWHLIQLDELRAPVVREFDDPEVQKELVDSFRATEGEKHFQKLSTQLELLAFENSTLAPVAAETQLEIKTSDWMTRRSGEGIAAVAAVRDAAFSPDVIQDDLNSRPIPTSSDSLVVLHKAEYEPARQLSLEDVKDKVRESVIKDQAAELARQAGEEILAEAKAGKSLKAIAEERGLKPQFDGEASRGQAELNGVLTTAIFKMARPEAGGINLKLAESGGGVVSVIALSEVIDPELEEDDKSKSPNTRRIAESLSNAEFAAFEQVVETQVGVEMLNQPDTSTPNPEF